MIGKDYIDWTQSACQKAAVVSGNTYRFSVLTPYMIRMEYAADGVFEDRATQAVINRNFSVPDFRVKDDGILLEVLTESLHLIYQKEKPFSPESLSVQLIGKNGKYAHIHRNLWRFGEEIYDLGGTVRSLDSDSRCTCINTEGTDYFEEGTALGTKVKLGTGLISKYGCSILDDKSSLVLLPDGFVEERKGTIEDCYFLGYGHDYFGCLRDFHHLCGAQPLLPRFALGNWWSRYYEYTQEEYQTLIQEFENHQIPFCVAMVDMDWHKIDTRYGRGWTGYTWNRALFPKPDEFIQWMHTHGVKVSLLDHPADGVRGHEDHYKEMADAMGKDYGNDDPICFDFSNPDYIQNYFDVLCQPFEKMGMDFWWIDWTQGNKTHLKGLDPLWALNHYHSIRLAKNGKRPLILSRYAGPGGHRYPISFSGDTIASWKSLDYQPYFTATSANAGYSWWSHDIGGHADGVKDDELETRWVQFGVFSPISRLHNTKNPFNGKEPWRYNQIAEQVMENYLRLRHKMIPYLYTMNYLCHKECLPVVTPLYYHYTEQEEAYQVLNEYFFGTELLVCPITKPMDPKLKMGKFSAWLPEGTWFDFFDGTKYTGNRRIDLYRGIENIPVFAKAGGIIPMAEPEAFTNSTDNPERLRLKIFAGANGVFHLYEDDGSSVEESNQFVDTKIEFNWEQGTLTVHPAAGNTDCLPSKRTYIVDLVGVKKTAVSLIAENKKANIQYDDLQNRLTFEIPETEITSETVVSLGTNLELADNHVQEKLFYVLDGLQIEFNLKLDIYKTVRRHTDLTKAIVELQSMVSDRNLLGIILEILSAG